MQLRTSRGTEGNCIHTLPGSIVRQLEIVYGYDNQRRKSVYTDGTVTRMKYFFGDYEEHKEGSSTTKYFFINSPTGLCGIYVIERSNPGQLYYTFNDHLGSVTELVNATTANVTRQSFDAWGNPRSVTDWTSPASYQLFAGRGFTGHEHLEEFSLINMNGRVYDPMLGWFLSPDPYVQLPDFSQSFNRYTYCLNNPLKYIDLNGNTWIIFKVLSNIGKVIVKSIVAVAIIVPITLGLAILGGFVNPYVVVAGGILGFTASCFLTGEIIGWIDGWWKTQHY